VVGDQSVSSSTLFIKKEVSIPIGTISFPWTVELEPVYSIWEEKDGYDSVPRQLLNPHNGHRRRCSRLEIAIRPSTRSLEEKENIENNVEKKIPFQIVSTSTVFKETVKETMHKVVAQNKAKAERRLRRGRLTESLGERKLSREGETRENLRT